jgi:hypothetical protein
MGASITGYEVQEDEACTANIYPLNSHLITLTFDTTFDRSVPFIHSVSPTSDSSERVSW